MTFVLGLLVVLVALYFIAAPYLEEENELIVMAAAPQDENVIEKQKESIFTTLNELEFDYRMKKISDEDYKILKNKYKSQAVTVLKSEEELDGLLGKKQARIDSNTAKQFEDEIEAQVAELRSKH